jgi:hypothetical protein
LHGKWQRRRRAVAHCHWPAPDKLAKPEAVREPFEKVVPSGVPFNEATDDEVNPVPVMAVVKMPSGNCPFEPTPVIVGVGATGAISVTVAVALPSGPVAVTASVPVEDIVEGAV